jgi:hypothetical protein
MRNRRKTDHPLSTVSHFLFNTFAATLHIWRPSPPTATWGCAMPWWQEDGVTIHRNISIHWWFGKLWRGKKKCPHEGVWYFVPAQSWKPTIHANWAHAHNSAIVVCVVALRCFCMCMLCLFACFDERLSIQKRQFPQTANAMFSTEWLCPMSTTDFYNANIFIVINVVTEKVIVWQFASHLQNKSPASQYRQWMKKKKNHPLENPRCQGYTYVCYRI